MGFKQCHIHPPTTIFQGVVMMLLISLFLAALITPRPASAQPGPAQSDSVTVTVAVDGAKSTDGQIVVALFATDDGFPRKVKKAAYRASAALDSTGATVEVPDVEPGRYAVLAFHDENADGEIDTNWVGMPKEGIALTNWTGGRPNFDDALTAIGPDASARIELSLQYR